MKKLMMYLIAFCLTAGAGWTQDQPMSLDAKKTYDDIKSTLGIVPTFMKDFPQEGITGAWEDYKGLELNAHTAIPGKYKELIGIAVAAQIPCKYCVHMHTQAAMLNGASKQEVKEAIAMAACTRRWSTFLYGTQMNENEFKTEVDKLHAIAKKNKNMQAMESKPVVTEINTAKDAYSDIERTLGFVPTFLKNYPESGIIGAWKEMKAVELNPATAIPPKYKHLIGLAVSAQVPCRYCTYYHTQSAMMTEVSKLELTEAVALAGVTREWSTVLNGQNVDEKKFHGEVNQIMKFLKNKSQKSVTIRD